MDASPVAMTWRGMRPLSRSMLLGVFLAAAVLLGLLTMHGHIGAVLTSQPSVTAHADPMFTKIVSDNAQSGQTPLSCAGCAEDSAGLLMICMFALLITLGLLFLRGMPLVRARFKPWRIAALWPTATVLRQPPSLHMLCISRR